MTTTTYIGPTNLKFRYAKLLSELLPLCRTLKHLHKQTAKLYLTSIGNILPAIRLYYCKSAFLFSNANEPGHDKTNKMSVRPAKTQISLGIRPVWSESSLAVGRKLGTLATHWAHSDDSDQTGRIPRLTESSLDAHSFCWFWHVVAQMI